MFAERKTSRYSEANNVNESEEANDCASEEAWKRTIMEARKPESEPLWKRGSKRFMEVRKRIVVEARKGGNERLWKQGSEEANNCGSEEARKQTIVEASKRTIVEAWKQTLCLSPPSRE